MRNVYVFTFLVLLACSKDEVVSEARDIGYPFFPLCVGAFIEYEASETLYQFETSNTTNFQIRTEVVDSFQNQAGEVTYVLHNFERLTDHDEWEFMETNSARVTDNQVIFIEGNVPILKLVFPIAPGRTWDSNVFNNNEPDDFIMDSLYAQYITFSGDTIPETLTIIQEDNQDFVVNLITNYEIYGLGLGLVYKEEVDLRYCRDDDCIGQQVIDNGRIFQQSVISYGQN